MSERGVGIVVVDVATLTEPDLCTVEALARLELAARRQGATVQLRNASPALLELLHVTGLHEILVPCPELPIEDEGQAEDREQPRFQEVRDRNDPTG